MNNTTQEMDFRIDGNSVSFWVRVRPRAQRERLMLDLSGELRLEVTAPAAEGKANQACICYLARTLRLPQASIEIKAGQKSRRKLIRITGPSAQQMIEQIERIETKNSDE